MEPTRRRFVDGRKYDWNRRDEDSSTEGNTIGTDETKSRPRRASRRRRRVHRRPRSPLAPNVEIARVSFPEIFSVVRRSLVLYQVSPGAFVSRPSSRQGHGGSLREGIIRRFPVESGEERGEVARVGPAPSPSSLLAKSKDRSRASSMVRHRTAISATSARGTERRSPSRRVSSTPTRSSLAPPFLSSNPPGWMTVKSTPDATRCISALRFHRRMLASPTSPPAPMVLRKLSICVPPMEETRTTFLTPAATAASICAFCQSQSTCEGEPPSGK